MNNFVQSFFLYALFWISLTPPSLAGVPKTNEPRCNREVLESLENFEDAGKKTCTCEFYSDGETLGNEIVFQYNRDFEIDCHYQNVPYHLFVRMIDQCNFKMNAVCDTLFIQNCPNFNVPYANLLEALHIEQLHHLSIISVHGLVPYNFKNLTSVEKLTLRNTTFRDSPLDMFDDMPNLTFLNISYGNFMDASRKPLKPTSVSPTINANESFIQNEWLKFPPNLKWLTFVENEPKLQNITKNVFANLNKLERLDFSNAGIEYLNDNVFDHLEQLKHLYLNSNNLTRLPANLFVNNRHLVEVSMHWAFSQEVFTLPDRLFANLPSLKTVGIEYNHFTTLPENLYEHSDLQFINMSHNELTTLPDSILKDVPLYHLDLSHNKLTTLPNSIFKHTARLYGLDMSHNKLTTLPDSIKDTNLERLDISYNRLEYLNHTTFHRLKKLHELYMSNALSTQMSTLPSAFFDGSTSLYTVYLDDNNLTSLPKDLFHDITISTMISLRNNSLIEIPRDLFKYTKHMNHLDLSYNQLEFLDDAAFDYVWYLGTLELAGNRLKFISRKLLARLPFLMRLDLHSNMLTDFEDDSFAKLTLITDLDLSNNQLTLNGSLSNTIWNSSKVLKLDNNRISYLSENAIALLMTSKTLQNLTLHNNPWQCDCQHQYFAEFLLQFQNTTIFDYNNITCQDNGQTILSRGNLCGESNAILFGIVTICVIAIIILVVFTLRYRNRRDMAIRP